MKAVLSEKGLFYSSLDPSIIKQNWFEKSSEARKLEGKYLITFFSERSERLLRNNREIEQKWGWGGGG